MGENDAENDELSIDADGCLDTVVHVSEVEDVDVFMADENDKDGVIVQPLDAENVTESDRPIREGE